MPSIRARQGRRKGRRMTELERITIFLNQIEALRNLRQRAIDIYHRDICCPTDDVIMNVSPDGEHTSLSAALADAPKDLTKLTLTININGSWSKPDTNLVGGEGFITTSEYPLVIRNAAQIWNPGKYHYKKDKNGS